MKTNRKDFLKMSGMAGLGMAGASMMPGCTQNRNDGTSNLDHIRQQAAKEYSQQFNMNDFAAPPMDVVRIGVIGLGNRGSGTVLRLASIEGAEITALCDLEPDRVESAKESISGSRHNPDGYSGDEDAWKRMCERDDIDLIAIATPWHLHAVQAVFAMEHEKHAYLELPAANTVEECWQLVETSERTRKHCVQMSANCHGGIAAVVLNMVRDGLFGEIIHGEGAYIHDLMNRYNFDKEMYHNLWRLKENIDRDGSLYPQHGLVPVAQMMDLNYGDQMDYLVSLSTNDFMMAERAEELAAEDDFWEPYVGRNYRGNLNTTLIRTKRGKSIMIQHDVTSPWPAVRFDKIGGTKGMFAARPGRIGFSYYDGWLSQEEYDELVEEYTPEINKRFQELVQQAEETAPAGHSYARVSPTDWRLIDCLRNGLPVEMNVYEAAVTSVVTPLSEWSVANGSAPIKVPDFTDGAWQTNDRRMGVNLELGGGTTRIV